MTDTALPVSSSAEPGAPASTPQPAPRGTARGRGRHRRSAASPGAAVPPAEREARRGPALLEQLAALYPQLFGAVPRPLKRGIFQDLMDAHPGVFPRDALKAALGWHTRSTRYLQAVAEGQRRHDLAGQPVEDMAPEHVHHALLEVFRRRKPREGEDLAAKLRRRLVQAFEASGLSREDYVARLGHRDAQAQAQLDEALAEWAARAARDEALLRAFEASGQSLEAFADMYGLPVAGAQQTLDRARRVRERQAPSATP